jgi:hypothetical protein
MVLRVHPCEEIQKIEALLKSDSVIGDTNAHANKPERWLTWDAWMEEQRKRIFAEAKRSNRRRQTQGVRLGSGYIPGAGSTGSKKAPAGRRDEREAEGERHDG